MGTEIRIAVEADYEAIARISRDDLGYDCAPALVREKLRRALQSERERVFVAVCGGEVAGYIHAEDYDVLYFETMKNVLGLAVAANHRRKGIGTKLLGAVEDWARETGVRQIRLNSGITRRGAHAFYRANGYTDEKEQKRFIKTLEA